MSSISPLINTTFLLARARHAALHKQWTELSALLSGRFNLYVAMVNIQRQGDLDLVLRCMEDEFEENVARDKADTTGLEMAFHFQLMLSEAWVLGCYEIFRAFRQR